MTPERDIGSLKRDAGSMLTNPPAGPPSSKTAGSGFARVRRVVFAFVGEEPFKE